MKIGTSLTEGPVFKKYMLFILPIFFSGVLQQLYNTADSMVVGKFAGEAALAAVGSTASLTNLILHLFLGLAVGANVVCSMYYGAGNREGLHRAIHTGISLAVISGVFLAIFGYFCTKYFLQMMDTPADIIDQSIIYMQVFFLGSPASLVYNFGAAILRAAGDTKRPLYILFVAGIINVILNLICVIVFHLGVVGVALGTVASQIFSAICVMYILIKTKGEFRFEFKKLKIYPQELKKIAATGIPSGFNGMLFSFSNVIIQSSINAFGKIVIAGNVAAAQVEAFAYLVLSSVDQGAVSFVGQNMGAKKYDRINKVVKVAMLVALVGVVVVCSGLYLAGEKIISMFTKDLTDEVIVVGMWKLLISFSGYLFFVPNQVLSGVLKGMGKAIVPTVISIIFICGTRLVWLATVLPHFPSYTTVFTAYPVSWAFASVAVTIAYFIVKKKVLK